MSARPTPPRLDSAFRNSRRQPLGWRVVAYGILAVGAIWVALTVLGGGEHLVSASWPLVAGLMAVACGGLGGLIVVAQRESVVVTEQTAALAEQTALTRFVLDIASDAVVSINRDGLILETNAEAEHMFGRPATEMLGRDAIATIVAAVDQESVRARIQELDRFADPATISTRAPAELLRVDGTVFSAGLLITTTGRDLGRRIHLCAHDASTQLAAERAVTEHAEDLSALLHVARELSGSEADQESRRAICRAARQLSAGEFAHVFELVADRNVLMLTASEGSGVDFLELPLTGKRSLLSDAFRSGEAVFSGDMLVDERADQEIARRVGIRAGSFQPIIRDGATIGVLVVGWRQPIEALSPRIASLLALFATQVAAVLERADLMARLADLARTDSLTGLANRRALDESLWRELARADRTGQPLTVALIDMDHFKRFNDDRGHQAGDWLLAETARAWTRELRPSDTLARYGGEEFVVVLPNCTVAAARHAVERLRGVVPAGQTCSAGIATRQRGESAEELLKRADAAMYEAKRSGRNRSIAAPNRPTRQPSVRNRLHAPEQPSAQLRKDPSGTKAAAI